eukprot:COSAG06_NODE_8355_length_2195_cov_1.312023_1_plen_81_part_10
MKFQQPESAADTTTTSVEGATAAAAAAAAVSAAPRLLGSLGRLLLLVLLGQSTACNSLPRWWRLKDAEEREREVLRASKCA